VESIGDPRAADPCALVSARALSNFGETTLDRASGNFNRCDVMVNANGRTTDVEAVLDNVPGQVLGPPIQTRLDGTVAITEMPGNGDVCERLITLAGHNVVRITATQSQPASSTVDLCALADAATNYAVIVLNDGPILRRSPGNLYSLERVDACGLLDAAELTHILPTEALDSQPGFGNWSCRWSTTNSHTRISLAFDRTDHFATQDGQPITLGGRQSLVAPNNQTPQNCVVHLLNRTYLDGTGNPISEQVNLQVDGPQPAAKLCGTATALGTAIGAKLPSP
jgi:hypothetical protein